jgi:hypothetical protein
MKIKALQTLSFVALSWTAMPSAALADVHVTMQNGRVSVVAKDATIRQILTEWARVGQTKIVNVEQIPGGPITIELTNVPESQALEVLLRPMSGYIAAPRAVEAANLSRYDRVIVMPTLASARPPVSSTPPPVFQQPQPQPQPQYTPPPVADDDADDEQPAPNVQVPPGRGPVFNTFPQGTTVAPQRGQQPFPQGTTVAPQPGQQPFAQPFGQVPPPVAQPGQVPVQQPQSQPSAPFGGVPVPGMVAPPPPQQQGQPGQPQPQTIPPRRPDGQ